MLRVPGGDDMGQEEIPDVRLTPLQAAIVANELEAWARWDGTTPFLKWKLRERAAQLRAEAKKDVN